MFAVLLLSAGIPMLSSGMDMLKSKGGENNTYLRGDLNAIPYSRAIQYSGTHEYCRRLIRFRLSSAGSPTRLDGHPAPGYFATSMDRHATAIVMNALRAHGPHRLAFAINPHFEPVELVWPAGDPTDFLQVGDHERLEASGLDSAKIPVEHGRILMPPLSCGIWIA